MYGLLSHNLTPARIDWPPKPTRLNPSTSPPLLKHAARRHIYEFARRFGLL